jgi:hypothetical protein
MVCGADSISDMDVLRHGGMGRLFRDVRAPSTLGTFLRLFAFGHVRQLDAVAAGLLTRLAAATPVLPDAGQQVFVDVDDTVRQTYGYAKQGTGRGYAAWLVCAAIAHNLTRAAAALAGGRHRRTRTGTIRTQLIHTPARLAHSAHLQVLHLPRDWPWEPGLDELFRRALHDPLAGTHLLSSEPMSGVHILSRPNSPGGPYRNFFPSSNR